MHEGLYESLLTRRLQALIDAVEGLDATRAPSTTQTSRRCCRVT